MSSSCAHLIRKRAPVAVRITPDPTAGSIARCAALVFFWWFFFWVFFALWSDHADILHISLQPTPRKTLSQKRDSACELGQTDDFVRYSTL